ncbi:hypothetical protein BS17DRAFT_788978 [Gyrodon lividus]|nr:hypothetical protein BS17DRAFT_788978 [Gyrodon lividus]
MRGTTNNAVALRLLRASHIPYDLAYALMLCSSYENTHGLGPSVGENGDVRRDEIFWMDRFDSAVTIPELSPSAQVVSVLRKYRPLAQTSTHLSSASLRHHRATYRAGP